MQQLRQKRVCLMCSLKVRNAGKPFMLENREKRKKTDFNRASCYVFNFIYNLGIFIYILREKWIFYPMQKKFKPLLKCSLF